VQGQSKVCPEVARPVSIDVFAELENPDGFERTAFTFFELALFDDGRHPALPLCVEELRGTPDQGWPVDAANHGFKELAVGEPGTRVASKNTCSSLAPLTEGSGPIAWFRI
jgi:hypothetical protein